MPAAAPRKKLIEVALPLEAINREAAREKSIRHGHPSTLHLWWARRPLAACRAVLFASLVDDPDSDPRFGAYGPEEREHAVGERRAELFDVIEELVKWENSNNPKIINHARAEIASSVSSRKIVLGELEKETVVYAPEGGKLKEGDKHPDGPLAEDGTTAYRVLLRQSGLEVVNHFLANYAPPVLDPFAGGGSIPLEAQRLGLRAYASDLNPVAVLINKALIEIPPKFAGMPPVNPDWESKSAEEKAARTWNGAQGLAEDVRYYGKWMRDEAEKRIGHLYPKVNITKGMAKGRPDLDPYVGQELTVIAWLWARTVPSPNPAFKGASAPLIKSAMLCTKRGKEAWLDITTNNCGGVLYNVRTTAAGDKIPPRPCATIGTGGARCLISGDALPWDYIRQCATAGQMSAASIARVAITNRGRVYLPPGDSLADKRALDDVLQDSDVPTTVLPEAGLGFRVQKYGITKHAHLYTQRQLALISTFTNLVRELLAGSAPSLSAIPKTYRTAVGLYLAFSVSKGADYWSSLCGWHASKELIRSTFGRPTLSMVWDYAEANPFQDGTGGFTAAWAAKVLDALPPQVVPGYAEQRSATDVYPYEADPIVSTDPPYYDNIGYADLSDVLYVWLRMMLRDACPETLGTVLTPKSAELIADPSRHNGDRETARAFFEKGLKAAFTQAVPSESVDLPVTVFYAFKQTESEEDGVGSTGWETMLTGLLDSGLQISGTWPARSEMSNRIRGLGSNALASSIVLACRGRRLDAPLASRRELVEALRRELPHALRLLQTGNVAPVDLAQAAIGPGMAVFSRYSRVVNADGSAMSVREALQLINQVLDEALTEQEGDFDADTRWALKWFEQYGQTEGPFGDAETLAKALAVSVNGLVNAGVVKSGAGRTRLLKREELDPTWDPVTDTRLTIWEITQHFILRLEQDGESGAAELLRRVGAGHGETARELAYRLYQTCERKKWADQARSYNGLVVSWPEIERMARERRREPAPAEATLFDDE